MSLDFFKSELWQTKFLGNTLEQFSYFLISFIIFLLVFKLLQSVILARLEHIAEKSGTKAGEVFIHIIESIKPPFYYFVALYLAVNYLSVNPFVHKIIEIILIIWVVYQVIACIQIFIDYLVKRSMGEEREKDAKAAIGLIKTISSIVLWVMGGLFIFSNLGINITSLVAGLGISGIAIALAIQNILKDLFSSFAIFFDKPFSVGDYIAVGDIEGVVKNIGIKTTRLQALQGEEIIISNQELTSAKIKNFSKLKERRVSFELKIAIDTPTKKIQGLPEKLEKLFEDIELARFDRAALVDFNKDGLKYEIVFHILSNSFETHLEVSEEVLILFKDLLQKESIKLA